MKIRSAVPENGCLIVLVDKKTKKTKKNICKTYTLYRLIGGCVNNLCLWASVMIYSSAKSNNLSSGRSVERKHRLQRAVYYFFLDNYNTVRPTVHNQSKY